MPAVDTTTINLRNDCTKQALFANPVDTTLANIATQTLENAERAAYPKRIMMAYERKVLIKNS